MHVKCTQCGAPLEVPDDTKVVRCVYCRHSHRLRSEPPRPSKPTKQQKQQHQQAVHLVSFGPSLGCATFIFVAVMIAWFVVKARQEWMKDSPITEPLRALGEAAGLPQAAWDGNKPFRCDGNDSFTIENVTANLPDHTAMTVGGNCSVRLVNARINAYEGLRVDGNGTVTIEESTIEATQTGIWADGNKRVELFGTRVVAGGTALRTGGNVDAVVTRGHIEGARLAFELSANASVDVRGSEISGEIRGGRRGNVTGLETAKILSRTSATSEEQATKTKAPRSGGSAEPSTRQVMKTLLAARFRTPTGGDADCNVSFNGTPSGSLGELAGRLKRNARRSATRCKPLGDNQFQCHVEFHGQDGHGSAFSAFIDFPLDGSTMRIEPQSVQCQFTG